MSSCSPKILSVLYMACRTSLLSFFAALSLVHSTSSSYKASSQLHVPDVQQTSKYSILWAGDTTSASMSLLQKASALKPAKRGLEPQPVTNISVSTDGEANKREGFHASLKPAQSNDIVFIHIPKTGGTSIEEAGLKQGIDWGYSKGKSGWFATGMHGESCNRRHTPPYLHPDDYSNKETFCIVREPYSRMISEYRYLRDEHWGGVYGVRRKESCVEGLNKWVQDTLRQYIYTHFMHDCHVIPQSQFIWGPDGQRWCQNILRFERLTDSVNSFMKSRAVPVQLTSHQNEAKQCPDLSARDFTAETLQMVQLFYRDDFHKLNYSLTP